MEYGYNETYRGCEIFRINDSGVKEYIQRIYKNEITWTRDYTFARHYALVSAEKMIEKLNAESENVNNQMCMAIIYGYDIVVAFGCSIEDAEKKAIKEKRRLYKDDLPRWDWKSVSEFYGATCYNVDNSTIVHI